MPIIRDNILSIHLLLTSLDPHGQFSSIFENKVSLIFLFILLLNFSNLVIICTRSCLETVSAVFFIFSKAFSNYYGYWVVISAMLIKYYYYCFQGNNLNGFITFFIFFSNVSVDTLSYAAICFFSKMYQINSLKYAGFKQKGQTFSIDSSSQKLKAVSFERMISFYSYSGGYL